VPPRLLSAFSSEWFSVALGTTATSVATYWMSALYRLPILRWVGLAFLIIGAASFAAISVLWAARGLAFPHLIGSDSRDLNRVSFTAVMPLEMIALGTALQLYLGTPRSALLLADYFAAFAASMSLSVLEGYLLYTKREISGSELTYALVIPPHISVHRGAAGPLAGSDRPGPGPPRGLPGRGRPRGELHALHAHRIPGARRARQGGQGP
jgi:tellurite resistance protein TehA-like permease